MNGDRRQANTASYSQSVQTRGWHLWQRGHDLTYGYLASEHVQHSDRSCQNITRQTVRFMTHLTKAMMFARPEYVILCGSAHVAQQEAATSSSAHPPLAATSAHDA